MPGVPIVARCPDCGATKHSAAAVCWLCGVKVPWRTVAPAPARAPARPNQCETAGEGTISTITSIAILVAAAAVCVSVWIESPGLGVTLVVLFTPGLVRMLYESLTSRVEGTPLTLGEKIETLVRSTAMFAGILVSLGVASGVAFFVFCLATLGGGSWH